MEGRSHTHLPRFTFRREHDHAATAVHRDRPMKRVPQTRTLRNHEIAWKAPALAFGYRRHWRRRTIRRPVQLPDGRRLPCLDPYEVRGRLSSLHVKIPVQPILTAVFANGCGHTK